ncbi:hypothetical protein NEPAR06_1951 [Nematocida parisii]|uniref:SPX domain-containing protein n=1 Tax=Nematocida parisii (strain ERTm3) TaxID=935791 RepID=I3EFG1_NEMP3|nr:uncharacterized protein NEPG_02132 [Nematocida parisii ERTm1]EIJ87958.1 hypothetical protein NEQG_02030 [Nematocida parisii ERTm3]KAI5130285.1 hypothetical protein NEPAR03_2037 [Nematocida parisii]EIJ93176.1 hypothetical protein NEPG_02132 [Nematocida parisii ERTm1]KAI5130504.1 hypothetical protein NEPAR08_2061 [Nematocida parisii]KAI5143897.1 hypothetical protein NEPAR04_1978 [Nematocida parisii]|eukprot:XP_013059959.1 hypothetical protein NEPG_02132 [Nematocida parisii ERTm1]
MTMGLTGIPYEEMLNNFIFKCTVRIALLNQEIQEQRALQTGREEKYNDLCQAVLLHADETRRIVQYINALDIPHSEKVSLLEYAKVATLESAFYNMGHALIEMKGLQAISQINTCFIRRTRKFWVDLNNIDTLCSMIIPHLPVYIFGDDGSAKVSSYISSVYFDTNNFNLYDRRIKRDQGAKSLRIRSYGESSIISYVELKTHEDGWTGERSTKKRFLVHTRLIPQLAEGVDIWDEIKTINVAEPAEAFTLYQEVLDLIRRLSLKPVVKTVYRRTAFQFPEDASIRISLDTHLAMWCGNVGKHFPYAILEVKLEEGNEQDWILELMNSALVVPVDKFSKYLHGCSVHYPNVPSIPYWYNQITLPQAQNIEIAHAPIQNIRLSKINREISELLDYINKQSQYKDTNIPSAELPSESGSGVYDSTSSSDSYSERQPHDVLNMCSDNTATNNPHGQTELHQNLLQMRNMQQVQTQNTNVNRQTMNGEDRTKEFFQPSALRQTNGPAVPAVPSDKPVTVPVRIEPKVFFANERTFLSWLHFAIFIGGVGAALMGLGDVNAALSGVCFIVVSIIFSVYALYLYIWRAQKINEKNPGPYHDHHGPIILVAVFLSAMVTSVFFKFPLK